MSGSSSMIGHIEFRPPDDLRLYEIPSSGVLRLDEEVMVAEVAVGKTIVRHYGFASRWLAVNVTTDHSGRLMESPTDHFSWAVKCHIATPMVRVGGICCQVDFWLDVLVSADGRNHLVEDEDEFAAARDHGLMSTQEASGAREELSEVLDLIRGGMLLDLLADVFPFRPGHPPLARPVQRLDPAGWPVLLPRVRPTW